MMSKLRFLYKTGVIIALLGGGMYWFSHHKSFGFSLDKISSNLAPRPEWASPNLPKERQVEIFDQPYRYLASGAEAYAFASRDGKYVIKFFRMKHLIPSLSDYLKPGKLARREKNLNAIFTAYKSAYDALKEETGLLFVHLNKTENLKRKLTVTDRIGRDHLIDLDQTEFVVQERAELIFSYLKKLLDQGDHVGVIRAKEEMLALVRTRIEKGFADQDKAVSHNYGFVNGRPIHLDIGRIFKGKKEKEYERISARIDKWLQENSSQ